MQFNDWIKNLSLPDYYIDCHNDSINFWNDVTEFVNLQSFIFHDKEYDAEFVIISKTTKSSSRCYYDTYKKNFLARTECKLIVYHDNEKIILTHAIINDVKDVDKNIIISNENFDKKLSKLIAKRYTFLIKNLFRIKDYCIIL